MERSKKEQIVAELHKKLGRASAAILTDYQGTDGSRNDESARFVLQRKKSIIRW